MVNYQASLSSEVSGLKMKHLLPSIPVRAYCLTDRIDLEGLMVENQANLVPHAPGTGRYALLRFDQLTNSRAPRDLGAKLIGISHSYMVVSPYGSVTMFNMHDREVGRYLEIIKRHASVSLLEMIKCGGDSSHNYIDYEVREQPDLHTWMQGGPNHIMLQHLNIDGICTIVVFLGKVLLLITTVAWLMNWLTNIHL
ncbi:uncharacterized protein LOC113356809 [Papaver somniferum]|uniref:uncharacterized protein LOC113356809 n=1 Tax=Papaver somniferum TaxID=3469 RepID=UPI000E6FF026|nr:uncharacterized protein LOC113356809 [Papaver somniferum]